MLPFIGAVATEDRIASAVIDGGMGEVGRAMTLILTVEARKREGYVVG
jgi:hypothetical protein